jgi:hypothetical protein
MREAIREPLLARTRCGEHRAAPRPAARSPRLISEASPPPLPPIARHGARPPGVVSRPLASRRPVVPRAPDEGGNREGGDEGGNQGTLPCLAHLMREAIGGWREEAIKAPCRALRTSASR